MAIAGEYDFVPLTSDDSGWPEVLSVGIFQWIYRVDGRGLKKSKAVYRVKGPAHRWQEINERARALCDVWNSAGFNLEGVQYKRKKSETI